MSLASSIKDFADILNDVYAAKGFTGDFPNTILVQQLAVYILKTIASAATYILTFQWFRDVAYLPLFAPELNPSSFFVDNLAQDPSSHILSLNVPPNPQYYRGGVDQMVSGLINSFFFSLPVSLPHLISIRRLFSQGNVAAAASVLGTVVAHSIFLVAVIFGLRPLVVPWFSLEPLNYAVGVVAVAIAVNSMAKQTGIKIVPWQDRGTLIRIALLNLVLTWCEEMSLFHSLTNLTLNTNNTYLDIYPTTDYYQSLLLHTVYVVSFVVGHVVFSALFYYLLLVAGEWVRSWADFTFPRMARLVNKVMIVSVVAFALSSLPYYGLDYLLMRIAGFLPGDPAYENSVLSLKEIRTGFPHLFKEIPPNPLTKRTPINLDLYPFDRGLYLTQRKQTKENKLGKAPAPSDESPVLSFEELNYQGEYAWIMRNDSTKELSKTHPNGVKTVLKKPRKSYRHFREQARKLQLEAASRSQKRKHVGQTPEHAEGIIPGESPQLLMGMDHSLDRAFLAHKEIEMGLGEQTAQQPGLFAPLATQDWQADSQAGLPTSQGTGARRENMQAARLQKTKSVDPIREELSFEKKVNSAYSKGFAAPFSLDYDQMRSNLWPIRKAIKRRYFANPVYRTLLETDIDTFLARQPSAYTIAGNQEHELYKKRQMLERYYNWLRYYEPLQKTMQLRYQIPNSRSFVDRVYHQQFKGTLKIARRLFKVTFDPEQNPERDRVLSYDQPLYRSGEEGENPSIHEELLTKDMENGLGNGTLWAHSGTPDLAETSSPNSRTPADSPFIEESSSSPMYVGWDAELRKLVVTNRFALKQGAQIGNNLDTRTQ